MENNEISNTGYLAASDLTAFLNNMTPQGVYKYLRENHIETILLNSRKRLVTPNGVRQLLQLKGFEYLKQIVAFQMIKGGVGKTTLSGAVALRSNHYGSRTLQIDLDLQGNLTRTYDVDSRELPVWLDVLQGKCPIQEAIIKIDSNLDLIPSNLNNSRLDIEMSSTNTNIRDVIRDKLAPILPNYDLVVIDCPPALNKVSASALCAADTIIIPVTPDSYAMDGLEMTVSEIQRLKASFKLKNMDYKVLWNKYDARERLGPIYMHDVAKDYPSDAMLPVVVRVDTAYKNALDTNSSIFNVSKNSNARVDIDQLTREILGLNNWVESEKA